MHTVLEKVNFFRILFEAKVSIQRCNVAKWCGTIKPEYAEVRKYFWHKVPNFLNFFESTVILGYNELGCLRTLVYNEQISGQIGYISTRL